MTATHPNVDRLRRFLGLYGAHDRAELRQALNDQSVWHVGGTHRLSGDYRGPDEIVTYFERVASETDGTLRLDPVELLANDERGAAFLRVTATRGSRKLDVMMAEAFQFAADGTIREFWAHPADQRAVDEFWGEA